MYKRVELSAFGKPDVLRVVTEANLPEPEHGQVRVKVLSAGTGFTDTIIRQGQYPGVKKKPPFTPGYDWFGIVDKLGPGVSDLQVGQFVADMPVIGGYTQYLCVDAKQLVVAPSGLDPAEAVCMILSYTTAYQMLTREISLAPGQRCLVHAAGGAVGSALLELGALLGLEMIGTGSQAKKALIEGLGAQFIDYRNEDVGARVAELAPGGVDAVFDTLGGQSWSVSYRCLRKGGRLVAFGALQLTTGQETVPQLLLGFTKLLVLWRLLPDGKSSGFYNIQTRRQRRPGDFNEDLGALFNLLAEGKLHPAIAERVALDDVVEIHRRLDCGDIVGKVVLDCTL
ncbi:MULTISPECIES: medium chain dehydrogenase/reductase family protein [Zhongshania]|jgi:NADPH:quinone reductase-like Zn-dependent oxidoreductase|uniref:NADPH:quinone reductase-like Zn-dependent oxidoreductase n=1 Tax=Zhongshania antarctica TaxID=641702 RepID=A0A840R3Q8_9GAMM|nr:MULTISPECIES: medium chain dehydrogenase/reductase family protein [Zhongshania]MBB5187203.1 NADPH:quinone reductase-like Zn-dependent oxidoreductase [Zhongshania antarctica]